MTPLKSALPIETIERILDFLHQDKKALKSCALTSRVFIPCCYYHLFRTLELRDDERSLMIVRAAVDTVLHPCRFSPYVRQVGITAVRARVADGIIEDLLGLSLKWFRGVSALKLIVPGGRWRLYIERVWFRNITTLTLGGAAFQSVVDLVDFLRMGPAVKTLVCMGTGVGWSPQVDQEELPRLTPRSLPLETVALLECSPQTAEALAITSFGEVHTLRLRGVPPLKLRLLRSCFKHFGSSLRTLELSFDWLYSLPHGQPALLLWLLLTSLQWF